MSKEKKHKEKCYYHLCDYEGHLKRCPYCNQDFCNNHFYPAEPHVGFEEYGPHNLDPEDTHPCPGWQEYEENENKKIWEKWGTTLDILAGRKTQNAIPAEEKLPSRIHHRNPVDFDNVENNTIPSNGKTEEKKEKTILVIWFVLCIFVMLVAGYTLINHPKEETKIITVNETVLKAKNVTITSFEPVNISNEQYVNDYYYDNKNATLTGFLEKKLIGTNLSGYYADMLVDDCGNEISLNLVRKQDKLMMPNLGVSVDLYNVTGTFKKRFLPLGIDLNVISIVKTNRTYVKLETQKIIYENITFEVNYTVNLSQNKSLSFVASLGRRVENLVSTHCEDGTAEGNCSLEKKSYSCQFGKLTKNPDKCGCLDGERSYDGDCIPVVTCSDGTLSPDCSNEKKMQCLNGSFIINARCGCPEGYVKYFGECKGVCEDGTLYSQCSGNKPFFCDGGKLIQKASKCGCNFGSRFEISGDLCLDLSKPDINGVEQKIHELINNQRSENGLSPLSWNDKIAQAARTHSEDMVNRNYFEHDSPEGHDFLWRYAQVGFTCGITIGNTIYEGAENIYQGWTFSATNYVDGVEVSKDWLNENEIASNTVTGWMNSPGHRHNILTSCWRNEGIGVAIATDGKVLVTEDFC